MVVVSRKDDFDVSKPWENLSKIIDDRISDFKNEGLLIPIAKRGIACWRVFIPDFTVKSWASLRVNRPDIFTIGTARMSFKKIGRSSLFLQQGKTQGYYADVVFVVGAVIEQ